MRTKHIDFEDTFPTMPAGLDDQGRWPTRQPMSAEACNETQDDYMPQSAAAAARFWSRYLLVVLLACAAGITAWLR